MLEKISSANANIYLSIESEKFRLLQIRDSRIAASRNRWFNCAPFGKDNTLHILYMHFVSTVRALCIRVSGAVFYLILPKYMCITVLFLAPFGIVGCKYFHILLYSFVCYFDLRRFMGFDILCCIFHRCGFFVM